MKAEKLFDPDNVMCSRALVQLEAIFGVWVWVWVRVKGVD